MDIWVHSDSSRSVFVAGTIVDLISDALPFGRLWYDEPNAISNAVGYAKHRSVSVTVTESGAGPASDEASASALAVV
jgi:hypothetical protein